MTLAGITDAWITDLLTNVAALSTVTTKTTHRYASWSPEQLQAFTNERHLAVWPNGDVETAAGFLAGSPPSDISTQSFTIVVWEEAASEATGLYDDDTANAAWLALYEAIRERLYVSASTSGPAALGGSDVVTRFVAGNMGMRGAVRYMELAFHVRLALTYT